MGRYHQAQEKTSFGLIVSAVIILSVIIAVGWLFLIEEPAGGQETLETKAFPLPLSSKAPEYDSKDQIEVQNPEFGTVESNVTTEPMEVVELPELDNSDDFFRSELLKIAPGLSPWLGTDRLISRYIMIINDFAQGNRLEKHMRFLKLNQPFSVVQDQTGLYLASDSYRRYDPFVAAINALDVETGLSLYKKIKPLMQQVYDGFGYPDNNRLEDIFQKAASEILAAPVIEQRLALVRSSVLYKFADPELESLNPVRKQVVRMGPENTRMIQNKVRRFVEGLAKLEE